MGGQLTDSVSLSESCFKASLCVCAGSRPALCVRSWSDPKGKAGEVDGFCASVLGYHCVPKQQQTKQEEISLWVHQTNSSCSLQ